MNNLLYTCFTHNIFNLFFEIFLYLQGKYCLCHYIHHNESKKSCFYSSSHITDQDPPIHFINFPYCWRIISISNAPTCVWLSWCTIKKNEFIENWRGKNIQNKTIIKKQEIAEKKLQHLKKYQKPPPYLLKGIWGSI